MAGRKWISLAGSTRRQQPARRDGAVDRNGQPGRDRAVVAQAGADAGKARFERGDDVAAAMAPSSSTSASAAGQVAPLRQE